MNVRQWEIWKGRPAGFQADHWFVIISNTERGQSARAATVNGLACFTLRGTLTPADVLLNGADGLSAPTACACDFLFSLPKSGLHSGLGSVSWERQQQIKSKLKEVFRL